MASSLSVRRSSHRDVMPHATRRGGKRPRAGGWDASSLGRRDDSDARHRLALGHRRDSAYVRDDAARGRDEIGDVAIEVIREIADLHPLLYIRSAFHERIEDSVRIARDAADVL